MHLTNRIGNWSNVVLETHKLRPVRYRQLRNTQTLPKSPDSHGGLGDGKQIDGPYSLRARVESQGLRNPGVSTMLSPAPHLSDPFAEPGREVARAATQRCDVTHLEVL